MPAGRLSLYRFVDDAWAGGLEEWTRIPGEAWLLVENAGQKRWLAPRVGGETRLLDPDEARAALAEIAGLPAPRRGWADAAFAVRVGADGPEDVAARNARLVARAADDLARAGWSLRQLAVAGGRISTALERQGALTGLHDRSLRTALTPRLEVRVCCVGWDAARWGDIALLDILAEKAVAFEMYMPLPRLPADALQREWVEAIEERLGLERVICLESGFESAHEVLVARLENSAAAPRGDIPAPGLIVGRDWWDEVLLVRDHVLAATADSPVGIIAPEGSIAGVAVAEALEAAGVAVERHGRRREPARDLLILEQVARYHLNGHDIEDLLGIARLLHGRTGWDALDPAEVAHLAGRGFKEAQSRNSRILARSMPYRKEQAWVALCKLVAILGRWDGPVRPAQAWPALLEGLGVARFDAPAGKEIPGRALMEWLADHLAHLRAEIAPPDYRVNARAVVTTFAGAAHQPWASLIFLDSHEHAWPPAFPENPFLNDAARAHCNQRRGDSGRLLATHDLRVLDHARFLDLLEHCRGPIAFAGALSGSGGVTPQPNEWVLRVLLETSADHAGGETWAAAARTAESRPEPELDEEERSHLLRVGALRRDPAHPFDEYQFNFAGSKIKASPWSATDLDDAITTPATFALKHLFHAEPVVGGSFTRGEGSAVGSLAHRWLGRALGLRDRLVAVTPPADPAALIARELAISRDEIASWYAADDLPLPIWWETCLRKAAWAARRCLREICGWLEGRYCAMEQRLMVDVHTPAGPLPLQGRIDILLCDRDSLPGASVRIFDFKTGRGAAPTLGSLDKGSGAQFAAYYLMARDAGATEAAIGIIKPDETARDVFGPADEVALRRHFARFAAMYMGLKFGRLGPLASEYGVCETLPLATSPIDPEILEAKAAL